MDLLTLDRLVTGVPLRERVIEVPELGGHVRIREFTKGVEQELRRRAMVGQEIDSDRFELLLLIYGIVEPSLSEDHLGLLRNLPAGVVNRLVRAVLELNGMLPEQLRAAEKSFPHQS